jgi:hypothetical protein
VKRLHTFMIQNHILVNEIAVARAPDSITIAGKLARHQPTFLTTVRSDAAFRSDVSARCGVPVRRFGAIAEKGGEKCGLAFRHRNIREMVPLEQHRKRDRTIVDVERHSGPASLCTKPLEIGLVTIQLTSDLVKKLNSYSDYL